MYVVGQPLSIVISTDTVKLATWAVMEQRISSIWCLLPLVAWLLSGRFSEGAMGEFCLFNGNYSSEDLMQAGTHYHQQVNSFPPCSLTAVGAHKT